VCVCVLIAVQVALARKASWSVLWCVRACDLGLAECPTASNKHYVAQFIYSRSFFLCCERGCPAFLCCR